MLNTHDVLLRNLDQLSGRIALIGLEEASVLPHLSGQGLSGVMLTENFGVYSGWQSMESWCGVFGYQDESLISNSFDGAVVFMPKSRQELAMRLALAADLVTERGTVLLIGGKKEGIAGGAKLLADRLSDTWKRDSARHCQVWQATVPSGSPAFKLGDWQTWHQIDVAGTALEAAGLPGIFSDGRLDEGTRRLLETFEEEPAATSLLDFACGAGVVSGWLATRFPKLSVDAVDVQSQALACTEWTLEKAGINHSVWSSDGFSEVSKKYPLIVSNPPFHDGMRTDTSMAEAFVRDMAKHLSRGGELRLVANSFLPYQEVIAHYIGPCEILSEDRRFKVCRAFRR